MSLRPVNPPTVTKTMILAHDVKVTDLLLQLHMERLLELAKTQPVYAPLGGKRGGTLHLPPAHAAQNIVGQIFSTC